MSFGLKRLIVNFGQYLTKNKRSENWEKMRNDYKRLLEKIIMRCTLTIMLGLLVGKSVFATEQIPDYLVYKGDTIAIFSNPLLNNTYHGKNTYLLKFSREC